MKMKSINYTYEKRSRTKSGMLNLGWIHGRGYTSKPARIKYQAWVIINKDGRKIAEASSEDNAALIVAALNGAAP